MSVTCEQLTFMYNIHARAANADSALTLSWATRRASSIWPVKTEWWGLAWLSVWG